MRKRIPFGRVHLASAQLSHGCESPVSRGSGEGQPQGTDFAKLAPPDKFRMTVTLNFGTKGTRMPIPTRLDHCVIHVSDWERSNAFYTTVMGAELVSGRPVTPIGSATSNSMSMGRACGRPRSPASPWRRAIAICVLNGADRSRRRLCI
jgi:Glyoxalase/Bleomycin resistance protein/Dioxygenase superfamily